MKRHDCPTSGKTDNELDPLTTHQTTLYRGNPVTEGNLGTEIQASRSRSIDNE